jgi:hypothetical protein
MSDHNDQSAPRATREGPGGVLGMGAAGFVAGCLISWVTWSLGWNALVEHGGGSALWVVPSVKFAGAMICMLVPGWRSFGAGLLLSIGAGALIFFVTCASHL